MNLPVNCRNLLACGAAALVMAGCASPANRQAMTPQDLVPAKSHAYSVSVQTAGGSDTGVLDSSNISDSDLKAALEDAISQNRVFERVVQGNLADYQLSVRVVNVSKPLFGATFTVDMECAWSLAKRSDQSTVMRRSVKSSGTASMSDAFAGVTRLRMAVENAARDNIRQGLGAISTLSL